MRQLPSRLVILGLLLLVAGSFSGPLWRRFVAARIRATTGMDWRFDIAESRFWNGTLVLENLTAVSSAGSAEGQAVADRVTASVKDWGILGGRVEIDRLEVNGLRHPWLDEVVVPDLARLAPVSTPDGTASDAASRAAREWVDSLSGGDSSPAPSSLPALAGKLHLRWQDRATEVSKIAEQWRGIRSLVQEPPPRPSGNPLRPGVVPVGYQRQLDLLKTTEAEARAQLSLIDHQVTADRAALDAALHRDLASLESASGIPPLTGRADIADRALVGGRYDLALEELAGWLLRLHGGLRQPVLPSLRLPARGRNIAFLGAHPRSSLLVRRTEVDGIARPGGQRCEYLLTLDNLSDNPDADGACTRVAIRSQGPFTGLVEGTVQPEGAATFTVTIPEIPTGLVSLGDRGNLGLSGGPGLLDIVATIRVGPEGCEGTAELTERVGGLQISELHSLARSRIDLETVNRELARIGTICSQVRFSGRPGQLQTEVVSGPGSIWMTALKRASLQNEAARRARLEATLHEVHEAAVRESSGSATALREQLERVIAEAAAVLPETRSALVPGGDPLR